MVNNSNMEPYHSSFSDDFLKEYIIVRHRESGELYCFHRSYYDQIRTKRNISHISKCPDELITVYLIDKFTDSLTNTYKSFAVKDLQGGASAGKTILFDDTW